MVAHALRVRLVALTAVASAALAATAYPAANAAGSGAPVVRSGDGFAGPVAVRAHALDRDVEPAGSAGLHRVACVGTADATTSCWVAG